MSTIDHLMITKSSSGKQAGLHRPKAIRTIVSFRELFSRFQKRYLSQILGWTEMINGRQKKKKRLVERNVTLRCCCYWTGVTGSVWTCVPRGGAWGMTMSRAVWHWLLYNANWVYACGHQRFCVSRIAQGITKLQVGSSAALPHLWLCDCNWVNTANH